MRTRRREGRTLRDVLGRPAHRVLRVLGDRVVEDLLGKVVGALQERKRQQRSTISALRVGRTRSGLRGGKGESAAVERGARRRTRTHVALMLSKPTAKPMSISPLRIWPATCETAMRPDEQKLRARDERGVSEVARREGGRAHAPVDDLERDRVGDAGRESRCTSVVGRLGREDGACRSKSGSARGGRSGGSSLRRTRTHRR